MTILSTAALLTSFAITFFAIPSIIKIAEVKHLFDVPDLERKWHKKSVPTLGGLAIFAGMIFSLTFWSTQQNIVELQYILSGILVLFFIGMKDDLVNLVAHKKLIGQIFAAFIFVHWGGISITSFFGIFGISTLGIVPSYLFSILTIVVITNSVNLIDGIDCLAASVGVIAASTLGTWFYAAEQTQYVILSASLVGSLLAFMFFNRSPARIFMGDTGSLIIGAVLSILAIKFIEMNRVLPLNNEFKIAKIPAVAIGILIIPLFDTLRVFSIRILQGKSPMRPDRNHLHHLLVDLGFSHFKALICLCGFNLLSIAFVFNMQEVRAEITLTILLTTCVAASSFLAYYRNKKKKIILTIVPRELSADQAVAKTPNFSEESIVQLQ